MANNLEALKKLLGEDRLKDTTIQTTDSGDTENPSLLNSSDIQCECKTIILKPKQAKLIVPNEAMREMEKNLVFLQKTDSFKDLALGCYWLVDDMYKFEHMGYSKEVSEENLAKLTKASKANNDESETFQESKSTSAPAPHNLRYLICADCNLCPLGWYDSTTKESYLHVW